MLASRNQSIDVVVPVRSVDGREYEKLLICCSAIRAHIPVNRLIMVTARTDQNAKQRLERLADITLMDETAIGVGIARGIGLQSVETEFYASIDTDVAVSSDWYPWCIRRASQPKIAACQGFARPLSRHFDKFVRRESLDRGTYADLGNTLLRTGAIREVGMPTEPTLEDHILRRRLVERGYEWIVNPELISDHLLTDSDVLWHRYWFGRLDPKDWLYFLKYSIWLAKDARNRTKKYGFELAFFLIIADLAYAFGSLVGYYSTD